jgi:hypothetical protein
MTLVVDAGTVAADSTGVKEVTINERLSPGWHAAAFIGTGYDDDNRPTVQRLAAGEHNGFIVNSNTQIADAGIPRVSMIFTGISTMVPTISSTGAMNFYAPVMWFREAAL